MKAFLQSRCGSHNLPVVGRLQGIPRFKCFCLQCHAQGDLAVGDEDHLIFECPAVQHVMYQHLFSGLAQTVQEVMWQMDMRSVVLCVKDCLSVLLAAPVAGATDDDSDLTRSQP